MKFPANRPFSSSKSWRLLLTQHLRCKYESFICSPIRALAALIRIVTILRAFFFYLWFAPISILRASTAGAAGRRQYYEQATSATVKEEVTLTFFFSPFETSRKDNPSSWEAGVSPWRWSHLVLRRLALSWIGCPCHGSPSRLQRGGMLSPPLFLRVFCSPHSWPETEAGIFNPAECISSSFVFDFSLFCFSSALLTPLSVTVRGRSFHTL